MPTTRRGASRGVACLLAVLLVVSCGAPQRPTVVEWLPQWEQVVAIVPDRADLGDDPAGDDCEEVLVALREAQETLLPSPNQQADQRAEDWLQVAESAFFECFGDAARARTIADTYTTLEQLESEVTAALEGGTDT